VEGETNFEASTGGSSLRSSSTDKAGVLSSELFLLFQVEEHLFLKRPELFPVFPRGSRKDRILFRALEKKLVFLNFVRKN